MTDKKQKTKKKNAQSSFTSTASLNPDFATGKMRVFFLLLLIVQLGVALQQQPCHQQGRAASLRVPQRKCTAALYWTHACQSAHVSVSPCLELKKGTHRWWCFMFTCKLTGLFTGRCYSLVMLVHQDNTGLLLNGIFPQKKSVKFAMTLLNLEFQLSITLTTFNQNSSDKSPIAIFNQDAAFKYFMWPTVQKTPK